MGRKYIKILRALQADYRRIRLVEIPAMRALPFHQRSVRFAEIEAEFKELVRIEEYCRKAVEE